MAYSKASENPTERRKQLIKDISLSFSIKTTLLLNSLCHEENYIMVFFFFSYFSVNLVILNHILKII